MISYSNSLYKVLETSRNWVSHSNRGGLWWLKVRLGMLYNCSLSPSNPLIQHELRLQHTAIALLQTSTMMLQIISLLAFKALLSRSNLVAAQTVTATSVQAVSNYRHHHLELPNGFRNRPTPLILLSQIIQSTTPLTWTPLMNFQS